MGGPTTFTLDVGFSTPVFGIHVSFSMDTKGTIGGSVSATQGLEFGVSLSASPGALCGGKFWGDSYGLGPVSYTATKSANGKNSSGNVGIAGEAGYDQIISGSTYIMSDKSGGSCKKGKK